MNIVVIGAGGVGGYFGGKLAQSGNDVTFLVREKHQKAIQENGLQIKSLNGDFTVHPKAITDVKSITTPDLIILGVKSWQVIDVAKQIQPIIGTNTMVLPLQNGADNADKLRTVLPEKNVLAGLCKIVSKVESPGVINHFAFEPEIIFGEYDNQQSERVQNLKEVFDKANFKNTLASDIHLAIWKKFLFITTISGIAALTRTVFGDMRAEEGIREIMHQTASEIIQIANAKNIALKEDDINNVLKAVDTMRYETTASMQRDIMEGKPSELENFNGYIVQQGKLFNIDTPANTFIYHALLPQEKLARKLT